MSAYAAAQAAQRAAADPNAHVFVTANAGSGKTKVLIDRIARLLLAGAKPSSFLCITYTKAAAGEMQTRLFEQLGKWCVASDTELRAALEALRGGARVDDAELPRARALFAQALETPGGLKIQTIHAFCERLLGRFPLEAGAPPGFDIADESRVAALKLRARGRLGANEDADSVAAFERFAQRLDSDRLDRLIGALVERRLNAPAAFAARIAARHGVDATAEAVIADALARAPWDDLRAAAPKLAASSTVNQRLADLIAAALAARADPALAWPVYCAIFLKADGEPREREPTKAIRTAEPFIDRLFSAEGAVQDVLAVKEKLRAIERAADSEAALRLAHALYAHYQTAKAQAGVLDFQDLIDLARNLLSKSAAAAWVLYKLDGGIDHILIDEGQDTSPDQWDLVRPLQDEFFAGAGARSAMRTVFAVGDPKQSIYSFQGADPTRFLAEGQSLAQRAQAAEQDYVGPELTMSFRSTAEVLQAVDSVCDGLELAGGAPEQFDVVRHTLAREGEGGRVEFWPLTPRPAVQDARPWDAPMDVEPAQTAPAILARTIARSVKAWIAARHGVWEKGKLRPMRPGDVMALVSTRGKVFDALIKAFKREGLPVAGADRMTLRDELAVEDCLALMRVALDPSDDLSLCCVLKGPWLGLADDDADIFPLAFGRKASVWDALRGSDDPRYERATRFIGDLIARAGLDAFGFLSWALETLDEEGRSGWARVFARLGQEARDPLEELLERALAPGRHSAPTLQRFLADIEADSVEIKREMDDRDDAIRVMTVHGAKGLEAPVVILPDTTGAPKDAPDNGVMLADGDLYYSPSAKEDDAVTARMRAAHAEKARREHWRLLYVAMTRARDRLVVCGFGRGQGAGAAHADSWHARVGSALARIGAPIETPFGEGRALGDILIADKQEAAQAHAAPLPAWARTPLAAASIAQAAPSRLKPAEPALLSPRRDGQARFRRGRLIHGLLERLPDIAPARRAAAAQTWLERQGVAADELAALAREALAVLEAPAFAAAFGPDSRAEAPIAGAVQGRPVRGVIDRLVVTPEEVLILDFKSDRPSPARAEDAPAAYVLQMALYRAVLMQIFPNRTVRCGLIWTEKPHLAELTSAQMELALERFGRG